jgi:uncharacterized protein (DUF1697 family)
MKYAVFLRGINVGGIRVPMGELVKCLQSLGLTEVHTLLQTGNVTFVSDMQPNELKTKIEAALSQQFHYQAHILIYSLGFLDSVIAAYPFTQTEGIHRYVIFCDSEQTVDNLMAIKDEIDTNVEDISKGKQVVYWNVPVGSTLSSKFGKFIAKTKYRSSTTTRNLNTLEKMTTNKLVQ